MDGILIELWEAVAPALLLAISGIVTLATGYASTWLPPFLQEWYNTRLRKHLHATALRAARAALAGDWKHFDWDAADQAKLIEWMKRQIEEGAGDAIAKWNPSDIKMNGIALNALVIAFEEKTGFDIPGLGR